VVKNILFFSLLFNLASCSSTKCHQKQENQNFIQHVKDLPEFKSKPKVSLKEGDLDLISVYKSDGSLQCGEAKAENIENFQMELHTHNIRYYKSLHESDGMIHIQACGTATGMIYVFEIQQKDQAAAEKLGYKLRTN
jgi:hypothetical protein